MAALAALRRGRHGVLVSTDGAAARGVGGEVGDRWEGGHDAKVSGACGKELGTRRGRAQERLSEYSRRGGGRVGARKGRYRLGWWTEA